MNASGYTPPFSPRGLALVAPRPPWHYAADFLTIDFRAELDAVACLLPAGLRPDTVDGKGALTASFAAWQACTDDGEELLDPQRSQYNECLIFINALLDDEPVSFCPYIYVDSDLSMVRGWLLGYPKKFGSVSTTRAFPLLSEAAPAMGPGGTFGGTLGLHDRRLAEARVTLNEPAPDDAPTFGSRPIIARRHFASLYEGEYDSPAVDELTRLQGENFQKSEVWRGEADLRFFESPTEDLDRLGPLKVIAGYRYSVSMSNRNNIRVADLREAKDG